MTRDKQGRRAGRRGARAAAVAVLLGLVHGCGRDDADGLARVGRKALARAEPLTEEANGRLAAGWQAIRGEQETAVATRVDHRLRWDKELDGAAITVQAVPGGVELRGKVRGEAQRQRAAELAQSTTGVENVTDMLEVVEGDP